MNFVLLKLEKTRSIFLMVILLTHVCVTQATWIIVKIDNQSDLIFTQAVRKDNVEIASISEDLQKYKDDHVYSFNLDKELFFGSSGKCKIIAQTPQGERVILAFFGDPTHRVANGRAHYADIDSRNAATPWKQSRLARVVMIQGDTSKLIGFVGYEDMNQQVGLKIRGAQGDYKAELLLL